MGFIASYSDVWADEMDVFGLRYYDSMDDYLEQFCWTYAFDILCIDFEDLYNLLGLEYDPKNYFKSEFYFVEYFTNHPDEMKKKYKEIVSEDNQIVGLDEGIDNIYLNFIYAAIIIRTQADEHFSIYTEEITYSLGSNEYQTSTAEDYLDFIQPFIFAEGEIAEKLIKGRPFFSEGPFYM